MQKSMQDELRRGSGYTTIQKGEKDCPCLIIVLGISSSTSCRTVIIHEIAQNFVVAIFLATKFSLEGQINPRALPVY